jgi:hypothetical protein
LKNFIKWTRRDYLKEMTFPDIPAYNNRLRHFSLDGPLGISDIMELVVGVERRVQRLPAPNQGLWNNAPVVPAVPPPANAQPMLPTQPHIMPGTQNDSASLLSQSAQLTSTPNGQQMLPPPCAQSGMAQSPQRSRITVHRDPQLPSVPALQASPRLGVLQDISNIPPAVRLSVSDQQSSEMNKSPPATPLQDHATPVDQYPTDDRRK